MTDETKVTEDKVDDVAVAKEETKTDEVKLSKAEYDQLLADKKERDTLKAHHDKVAQEKQTAIAKAAKEKAESEGDFKKLLELKDQEHQEQLRERDDKLNAYENEKKEAQLSSVAMKIASELTKSSVKKAETLANILKSRLKVTEDGVKVTDGKGNIISDSFDSLAEFAKKEYDFLCDGLQSTGGAGVAVVKPTGQAQDSKMDPVTQINRALGIK